MIRPNSGFPGGLSVVLVSTQRKWHGGEEQARQLARGLHDRGHRCCILARRDGMFAERMSAEGLVVATFSGNGWSPLSLWRARDFLRQVRPDVLHFNDPHAMTGAGVASLGLGIPARVVSRRVDFALRSAVHYRLLCDRVICVSRAVMEACRTGGIPSGQLRLVHEGVDPARVGMGDRRRGRRALDLSRDQRLLLTVATLTDHKGHRFLLDAMPNVLRRNPNVRLALAGDGELMEPLKRQADRLGIDPFVRFLGFRRDVVDLIHAADLFVLPSHLEGLCTSLIDVMLARRPIVTTTAGGIPDLVGPGDAGEEPVAWTVPPRDSTALAEAILDALASEALCAERTQRASRRAEQRFGVDHMVEATVAVYREVIADAARHGPEH